MTDQIGEKPCLKFPRSWADNTQQARGCVRPMNQRPGGATVMAQIEILTVLEVAHLLRVPKSTVYKLARLGQIPASKIGKHWRFVRRDLDEWVHRAARLQ